MFVFVFISLSHRAFVAPGDIQAFTSEVKNKVSARCRGKTVKYFAQAVKEICEAFEELQQKNASGLRDDTDRKAPETEAPSVDGVGDDRVEDDSKDGIDTVQHNGETVFEGLGDCGSGLDNCFHRQGEPDDQDVKPAISADANDDLCPAVFSKKKNKVSNGAQTPKEIESTSSPDKPFYVQEEISINGKEEIATPIEGLSSCHDNVEVGSSGRRDDGQKDGVPSSMVSIHAKSPGGGQRALTNGHKSKKVVMGSKRKCESMDEVNKNKSSATSLKYEKAGSYGDLPETGGHFKDGTQSKIASGGSMKESSPDVLKSDSDVTSRKKALKAKRQLKVAVDLQKDAMANNKAQSKGDFSGGKKRAQLGHGKHKLVNDEITHSVKRLKCVDPMDNATKKSHIKNIKNDSLSVTVDDKTVKHSEIKKSVSCLKVDNCMASEAETGIGIGLDVPGDEDVLPHSKRRRRALEAMSDSATLTPEVKIEKNSVVLKNDVLHSKSAKPQHSQLKRRRRTICRFEDDDDEEPKTPVHGPSRNVNTPSHISNSIKEHDAHHESSNHTQLSVRDSGGHEESSSKECSPRLQQTVEKMPKRPMAALISHSPQKLESEKLTLKEAKQILSPPKKSPLSVSSTKPMLEQHKAIKSTSKVSSSGTLVKAQSGSGKSSGLLGDSLIAQNQGAIQRNKPTSTSEKSKATPKANLRLNDSATLAENPMENNSLLGERYVLSKSFFHVFIFDHLALFHTFSVLPNYRLEVGRNDQTSSSIDPKMADSVLSMKHLIAAAQAKRRQAHTQIFSHGNPNTAFASNIDVQGSSPSPVSAVPLFPSGTSSVMQTDMQGIYPHTTMASPSAHSRQFASQVQLDIEDIEDRRVGSGPLAAGGSLSGGTEAAVARDAFEGMIETLSRTKESIGRATRLAIDCAKYGIANEVGNAVLFHLLINKTQFLWIWILIFCIVGC